MKISMLKFYAIACGSLLFFTKLSAQMADITLPANNAILTELPSITGSAPKGFVVKISIAKQESDEEWAYDAARRTYRWITGPTGQWLSTVSSGTTWTAPGTGYRLPGGTDLPPGKYVIYAVILKGNGLQVHHNFTIR